MALVLGVIFGRNILTTSGNAGLSGNPSNIGQSSPNTGKNANEKNQPYEIEEMVTKSNHHLGNAKVYCRQSFDREFLAQVDHNWQSIGGFERWGWELPSIQTSEGQVEDRISYPRTTS